LSYIRENVSHRGCLCPLSWELTDLVSLILKCKVLSVGYLDNKIMKPCTEIMTNFSENKSFGDFVVGLKVCSVQQFDINI
jgi:hypothetical protein